MEVALPAARSVVACGILLGVMSGVNGAADPCAGQETWDSTFNHPMLRQVDWACVRVAAIKGGRGHIGIDHILGNYSPGNNHLDPFYGANVMSKDGCASYYRVESFSPEGTSFPYGIFIGNVDRNMCSGQPWCTGPEILVHNWANRLTQAHLEIYSEDPRYGNAAIWASNFSLFANGGAYSEDLGVIHLPDGANTSPDPRTGVYQVAKLNGFVFTREGVAVPAGRMTIHMWGATQQTTSTGVPLEGFASMSNVEGGYYNSGWLYPGLYRCMVFDNSTGQKLKDFQAHILRPFERIDFTLE